MTTIGDHDVQHSDGDALLLRISTEMVRAQKRFFGKGPPQAKSYFLDDMLIVVMKGGLTTAEKTMLDFGQDDEVRAFRQVIENQMTDQLAETIETLTGRKVIGHQSQVMFSPDRIVEMFVFDDRNHVAAPQRDARGHVDGEPVARPTARMSTSTPDHARHIPSARKAHSER